MKKSKKIIISVLAILLIVAAFIGGNAYAKYMSKVTGKGNAEIASFKLKLNDSDGDSQAVTIPLKSTINNEKLKGNKIAPGTQGQFQIKVDTTGSDVGVSYAVSVENETEKPENLKFYYNGATYNNATDLTNYINDTINADDENKVRTYDITWRWDYETGSNAQEKIEGNKKDGEAGKKLQNYTFDIVLTGTQVKPM